MKRFYKCSPQLPVRNLRQTLDYYRDVLGFTEEWTFGDFDGGIRKDDLRLIFSQDETFTNDINNKNHRLDLMWFVTNIEEIYADFKRLDVNIIDQLQEQPYGLKEFAFVDINGYCIRVAESV
ncbi:VOC family protein [Algoriphagus halophilus]|uniref:Glyoxalase-like domain-containing protein n=1 Tax=Algoriphagus halophilus TaxID=226505 RepID=A0A1N6DFP8_9BACT|nr:VOC family protein [Algoriphagus halophilus]SIN69464.1 Glyoxalase-like domain-containing protein [Algoriphagus halophilus]